MTIIYLVKKHSDEEGKIMSLDELNKLNKANVYNVRIDDKKNINKKPRVRLTTEEIQLMVNSGIYKELHIQEVYNRVQGLAEKALQI